MLEREIDGSGLFLGRRAKIRWDFTYNSLEFEYGRRFFLDSSWSVRLSFGLKAVWFDETTKLDLFDVESFNPFVPEFPSTNESGVRKFGIWGVGLLDSFYGK